MINVGISKIRNLHWTSLGAYMLTTKRLVMMCCILVFCAVSMKSLHHLRYMYINSATDSYRSYISKFVKDYGAALSFPPASPARRTHLLPYRTSTLDRFYLLSNKGKRISNSTTSSQFESKQNGPATALTKISSLGVDNSKTSSKLFRTPLTHAQISQPLVLTSSSIDQHDQVRLLSNISRRSSWRESPFLDDQTRLSPRSVKVTDPETISVTGNRTDMKTFAMIVPCNRHRIGCYESPVFPVHTCANNCKQVYNLSQADVVVFYVFRMVDERMVPVFHRPAGQRWLMMDPEPPCRKREHDMLGFPSLRSQFNWTLSYRLDADIPWLYGLLRMRSEPPQKDYYAIFRRKSVTAAWFVGHCDTWGERDKYVKYMQEYGHLDVHIFGKCGNYSCSGECNETTCSRGKSKRGSDNDKCLPLLSEKYFFYLAFENSLCNDYVTEKFFKIFKDVDTIPVVRGGADYKRYFPPSTYVDAADFDSPADLAVYLIKLTNNRWRYTEMLMAKNKYQYVPEDKWFCKLCDKMHSEDSNRIQWYPDMRSWYVEGQCKAPDDVIARRPVSAIPERARRRH